MKCHPGHAQDYRRSDKRNLTGDPVEATWINIYEMRSCGSRGVPKILNTVVRPPRTASTFAYLSYAGSHVPACPGVFCFKDAAMTLLFILFLHVVLAIYSCLQLGSPSSYKMSSRARIRLPTKS